MVSIALNAILAYQLLKSDEVDRTPPWHPFKLNSELTLESVVKDGYRFASIPCGQVQYTKQIGDTIIQYEVEVDCMEYKGQYQPFTEDLPDEEIVTLNSSEEEELKSDKQKDTWEEERVLNKYFPWNLNEINDCYQKINWRVFTISLGTAIDSSFVRNYVQNKGGYIMESTGKWNSYSGGSFMVNYHDSNLYFFCTISNENYNDSENANWLFQIVRYIPQLDNKSIMKEKEWQKKKEKYYKQ